VRLDLKIDHIKTDDKGKEVEFSSGKHLSYISKLVQSVNIKTQTELKKAKTVPLGSTQELI
jgi:hypothetical protein